MTLGNFTVVSSFFFRPNTHWAQWLYPVWFQNLYKHADPWPAKVVIFAHAGCGVLREQGAWVHLRGDLGGTDDILYGRKPYFMGGCAASWMAGAWTAYMNGTDMLVVEQDVLFFGPVIKRMYDELGSRQAIFGRTAMHGISTSLFLVRHAFLPQFVSEYLAEGRENCISRIPEAKMLRMLNRSPENYCHYSFGYCKNRPFNPKDDVWFSQKFSRSELLWLESLGLLSCEGIPDGVEMFSNNV